MSVVEVRRPAPTEAGLTPLMRQYLTAKSEHEDSVLLFRMGDFWETFYEDAILVSRVVGVTLTSRSAEKGERVPLAGVPLASLEKTVSKLVEGGHRVAICDQVEDPKESKGIVKREVVEVISAGTATYPGLLDERANRFLLAVWPDREAGRVGIARCDVTTGEFVGSEIALAEFGDEMDRLQPTEVLIPAQKLPMEVSGALNREGLAVEKAPKDRFLAPEASTEYVQARSGLAEPAGEAPLFLPLAATAASALLDYLESLAKAEGEQLDPLSFEEAAGTLVLDEISLRNLEILRPLRETDTASTLLSVLDRTRTPMGARLLKRWLARPLLSPERIASRQDAVQELREDAAFRADLEERLDRTGDVARLATRIAAQRAHGRDLVALADSLEGLPALRDELKARNAPIFHRIAEDLSDFEPEVESIREAIVEEPPLAIKEGGIIREGFDADLDRLSTAAKHGKDWIAELQATERERTGVANLKVGYNRVFGYYLEVTKANKHLVPDNYERRQTLVNAERYITPELKERESEILGADEKAKALEYDLFLALRQRLATSCARIRRAAAALATLDVLANFASLAARENWVRPVVHGGDRIAIVGGRHPVVQASLPAHEFVPNDARLDGSGRQILLITGPNMAGKSTYLRQVALLCLLAQTGSCVPADEAEIGVVDRIFTRVGASDHVAAGQSTFMVEMVEVARILASATPRSLVLLDEIGRGTSTYDGLAIAWAVTEFLHQREDRAARTLFATHYHELTELADDLPRAVNLRVTVHEWKDEVVFLRKIVEGAADRSFGIQVAKLAGLPGDVTRRATKILSGLEDGTFLSGSAQKSPASGSQLALFSGGGASILSEIESLEPERMTPMDALAALSEWRRRLRDER